MSEETQVAEVIDTAQMLVLEEMTKAGVLYGRRKSKTNPKMKRDFVFTTRNGIEIFDLPKTLEAIDGAIKFLSEIFKKRGLVLFVGTEPASKKLTKELAEKLGAPYVTERWLGGTLTNFKTVSLRIGYYLKLKKDKAEGRLEKYTKKEQVMFEKKIEKMRKFFHGLQNLDRTPEALVVVDAAKHMTAIREAHKMKLPVIAIMNSDLSPKAVEYPIPANTTSLSSVKWILGRMEEPLLKAKSEVKAAPAEIVTKDAKETAK